MAAISSRHRRTAGLTVLLGFVACQPGSANPPAPATARTISLPEELLWGASAGAAHGDVRMENGVIVAVIAAAERAVGFAATGGNLIDLAPLPEAEDELNQVFLFLADHFPRQGRYETTEILDAGGAERPARVRSRGTDTHDPSIRVETEYVLEPRATWLTLISRFTATGTSTIRGYAIGDAIQWGRAEHLAPGYGFELRGRRVEAPWVGGIGEQTSYAMVPDGPGKLHGLNGSVWSDPVGMTADLVPGKIVTYVRHLAVGRGDTASLQPAIAHLRREATGRIEGTVQSAGDPVPRATVQVLDDKDALLGLASTDARGRFAIELAPGAYRLFALAAGRESTGQRQFVRVTPARTASASLTLGAEAAIRWRIESDDGFAPPLKVTVIGIGETPTPDFGPTFRAAGSRNVILSPRGVGSAPVGRGRYRVYFSRGPEHELIEAVVDVAPGSVPEIHGKLEHSVDSRGFLAADLHQHAVPSFDSGVSLRDRALSNAAEGLEVLVSTDHNTLSDYRPVIAAAGLGRHLSNIIGTEATTHSVGHFNAFPLKIDRAHPRGGMIDPEGQTPGQIFQFLRGLAEPAITPFIQVNHPRAQEIGYFDLMGMAQSGGVPTDPRFSQSFDGIEVLSFGYRRETEAVFADWLGLLLRGARVTATGNSDSHTIVGREVGWPRTLVCASDDNPTHLDVAEFARNLRAGCATVSAGPILILKSHDVPMGGTIAAKKGRFEVEVIVRAPTWIPVDRLQIYVNDQSVIERAITGTSPERYHETHTLSCARDCFVLARVEAAAPLPPVLSAGEERKPFSMAIANPIYVDADGNGRYERSIE